MKQHAKSAALIGALLVGMSSAAGLGEVPHVMSGGGYGLSKPLVPSFYVGKIDRTSQPSGTTAATLAQRIAWFALSPKIPDKKFIEANCKKAVLNLLKSPSTAKFVDTLGTIYFSGPRIYATSGFVDAQNRFGTPIREQYLCNSAYVGDFYGGLMYFSADIHEN